MIAFPAGVKVWIAGGTTDMRRGMNTLALQVQEGLGRDPHAGEISRLPRLAVAIICFNAKNKFC
jgi:transposase